MDILGYSSYGWLPSALYLALLLVLSFKAKSGGESGLSSGLVQAAIFVILVIHGVQLHDSVFTPQGFVFGFAQCSTYRFGKRTHTFADRPHVA